MHIKKAQIEQARNRLKIIDRMVATMYMENAEGIISDDRLSRVVADPKKEASVFEAKIAELDAEDPTDEIQENYERFFALTKQYTYIEALDRDTLITFIARIEIGEKILPEGYTKMLRATPGLISTHHFHEAIIVKVCTKNHCGPYYCP